MFLTWMGQELAVIDETDGSVCHVFERGDEPRHQYKYMTSWIEKNWAGDFSGMWDRALHFWEGVSEENKACIWSIDKQLEQNFHDIRTGLLATLKDYQGASSIKRIFEEALADLEY